MPTAHRSIAGLIALGGAAALAACGSSATSTSTSSGGAGTTAAAATSAPASATTPAASGAVLASGPTTVGTALTSGSGLTLYYFMPEKGGKVVCAADSGCNGTWPPVTAGSAPTAPSGFSGQTTLVSLPNGGSEVAYNGWPLHRYAGDTQPGQANGQGIGGQWFAVTPALTSSGSSSSGGGNGGY